MAVDYTADGFIAVAPNFTPVSTAGNRLPGDRAVNQPYTVSPDFNVRNGYRGEQTGATGGGFDPNRGVNQSDSANSIGGAAAISQNFNTGVDFTSVSLSGNRVPGDRAITEEYNAGPNFNKTGASVLSDPTNSRPGSNIPGGYAGEPAVDPSVAFQSTTGPNGAAGSGETDWRVRISLADNAQIFYKDSSMYMNVMAPLIETNGVIFPYTPSITVTHSAQYSTANPTHSNYMQQFYNNSQVEDITITGEFSVQSREEGQYLMAAIYFFRSATKMFFGSGANVGNPPPIVFLDGYGSHYFPHVPCVISAFTHVLGNDVDYIEIPIATTTLQDVEVEAAGPNSGPSLFDDGLGGLTDNLSAVAPNFTVTSPKKSTTKKTQFQTITNNTRVPTNSQISITLKPVYSRKSLHERFDLNKFAAGLLLRDSNNGFGGFL